MNAYHLLLFICFIRGGREEYNRIMNDSLAFHSSFLSSKMQDNANEVIVEESQWVVEIEEQLRKNVISSELETWKKRSIYKLPSCVTDLNKKAYAPQAVSFGPYHHGRAHLKCMEEHKHRALLHFVRRSEKPLQYFMESLAEVVQQLKDSYDSLDSSWHSHTDNFLKLMMLDGCFMIEVFRTCTETFEEYSAKDPIFSQHGKLHIIPYIRRDMLMLENQLPLLVLHRLAVESGYIKDDFVNDIVLRFFYYPEDRYQQIGKGKFCHILDVFRKSLIPDSPEHSNSYRRCPSESKNPGGHDVIVRSATELHEAGIWFKQSNSRSLKDISFRNGILKLPPIVVDDTTESTFLNLIAFERFHVGVGNEVTSYVFLMDNIIDSERDVALLNSKGIIQNAVGSDKAVATMFNSLSRDTTIEPASNLEKVQVRVNKYCAQPFHKWRANLCHTYFRSPWALLSLTAAAFLFAFTILQTAISLMQFIRESKSSPSAPPSPAVIIPRRPLPHH